MVFVWWRKTGMLKNFLYNLYGTLIRMRIIPVKVDRSLTGIIRTYVIIPIESSKTEENWRVSEKHRDIRMVHESHDFNRTPKKSNNILQNLILVFRA